MESSRASLSLLSFGCSSSMASMFQERMRNQGVDTLSLAVSNTPTGDAEVARSVGSRNWTYWMVGLGLMQDAAWFTRLIQIVKKANPTVILLDVRGSGDVENAILRQHGVRLPLATI